MRVVILGCGRLGAKVAEVLDRHGHDVTVLARDAEGFSRLPKTFSGKTSVANLIDVDELRDKGVKGADALIALTDGDNTNVMACQIAKHILGVPIVISQIKDPEREDTYNTLGIQTICPTRLGADKIREVIAAT
ncbi:MAG TPA: TrkA family potassium uptake protein [Chloroflexota bacterium]|nr:TrkA family potassium uptake protein [Chloroflexota bacterium]